MATGDGPSDASEAGLIKFVAETGLHGPAVELPVIPEPDDPCDGYVKPQSVSAGSASSAKIRAAAGGACPPGQDPCYSEVEGSSPGWPSPDTYGQ